MVDPISIEVSYFAATSREASPISQVIKSLATAANVSGHEDDQFRDVAKWISIPENVRQIEAAFNKTQTKNSFPPHFSTPPLAMLALVAASGGTLALLSLYAIWRLRKIPEVEIRRLVYSQRWVRQDEIVQVPPGATVEHTTSRIIGISTTRVNELSTALGFAGTIGPLELAARLSERVSIAVNISEQRSTLQSIKLTNDTPDRYRRYALWNVQHQLTVATLRLDTSEEASSESTKLRWEQRASTAFVSSPTAESLTYREVMI
jgi:hypothetical protein